LLQVDQLKKDEEKTIKEKQEKARRMLVEVEYANKMKEEVSTTIDGKSSLKVKTLPNEKARIFYT